MFNESRKWSRSIACLAFRLVICHNYLFNIKARPDFLATTA